MKRFKCLDRYQKGILLFLAAMVIVFTIAYPVVIAREGFAYRNAILIPHQENGNTVYSGKIKGEQAVFTVYADNTVEFQYGGKVYGPYTAREDSSAVTEAIKAELGGERVAGIEFCKDGEIIFRGGVVKRGDYRRLYNEDGSADTGWIDDFWAIPDNAVEIKRDGKVIDPMEPGILTVLDLMAGPELAHKGEWVTWFGGVFICILTAVSILFADELFRWDLSFRISNPKQAEPSEWEMMSRYIGWVVLSVAAMAFFIEGLR